MLVESMEMAKLYARYNETCKNSPYFPLITFFLGVNFPLNYLERQINHNINYFLKLVSMYIIYPVVELTNYPPKPRRFIEKMTKTDKQNAHVHYQFSIE